MGACLRYIFFKLIFENIIETSLKPNTTYNFFIKEKDEKYIDGTHFDGLFKIKEKHGKIHYNLNERYTIVGMV